MKLQGRHSPEACLFQPTYVKRLPERLDDPADEVGRVHANEGDQQEVEGVAHVLPAKMEEWIGP